MPALPLPEARNTAGIGCRHGGLNGGAYAACTLFLPEKSSRKRPILDVLGAGVCLRKAAQFCKKERKACERKRYRHTHGN